MAWTALTQHWLDHFAKILGTFKYVHGYCKLQYCISFWVYAILELLAAWMDLGAIYKWMKGRATRLLCIASRELEDSVEFLPRI